MKKGEITAFLSLIFVLMISFVTAILESASVQAEKNQARLDMDRAVYSVFGEYQKELLEEYGIFAVEGSYETGNFSEKQLIDRMHYYGASGVWSEVEGIQFLTDQNGQAFREGAVKYMEDLYGISIIQGLGALAEKWEQQEITGEQTKDESNQSLEELDDMLNQNQSSLPMENNPLPHIEQLKKSGLISLVFPKEKQVSQKQIRGEEQASSRALRTGRGTFPVRSDVDEITKKLLFHEYILKKFGKSGGGAEQAAFDPDGAEFCISADGYSKTGGGRSYGIGACNGSSASDAGACSQTGIAGSVGIRGKCHGFTFSDVRRTRCSGKNSRELAAVALFPDEDGNQ